MLGASLTWLDPQGWDLVVLCPVLPREKRAHGKHRAESCPCAGLRDLPPAQ